MGSLTIYFEDEYPRQTIHRNKFVNYLKETLSKEPNAFGENYPIKYVDARPGEMRETLCTDTTARDVLDWNPKRDVMDFIKENYTRKL